MSYATIIAAIDAAIESWADQAVTITAHDGRSITYRSLADLIAARKFYAKLAAGASGAKGFGIGILKAGDAR